MIYLMLGELGKNPSLRWELNPMPTTLRDLVRCSNHLATGDSMVSKSQFVGLDWKRITWLQLSFIIANIFPVVSTFPAHHALTYPGSPNRTETDKKEKWFTVRNINFGKKKGNSPPLSPPLVTRYLVHVNETYIILFYSKILFTYTFLSTYQCFFLW